MEAILTTVGNLLPYHLLSYGALLGTELYQVNLSLQEETNRYHQKRIMYL